MDACCVCYIRRRIVRALGTVSQRQIPNDHFFSAIAAYQRDVGLFDSIRVTFDHAIPDAQLIHFRLLGRRYHVDPVALVG